MGVGEQIDRRGCLDIRICIKQGLGIRIRFEGSILHTSVLRFCEIWYNPNDLINAYVMEVQSGLSLRGLN